jgi:hypothetical protein
MTKTLASGVGDDSEPRISTNGMNLTTALSLLHTQLLHLDLWPMFFAYRLLTHRSGLELWGRGVV